MRINLKTTILLSSLIAATLNVGQLLDSYQQQKDAFSPAWASAAGHTPAPPAPAKPATILPGDTSATSGPNSPAARLAAAGFNPIHAALYLSVQQQTGTPWQLLAAVHMAETHQSGSTSRSSYAGATGPMQFMPATFRHYGADGNGDGVKDIHNLDDSMLSAGRYLAATGAARGQYSNALYRYNHSGVYVSRVLSSARRLGL